MKKLNINSKTKAQLHFHSPSFRATVLSTCDSSHRLKLTAAHNFYIKAQCATAFHHLFIRANSIIYRVSMILSSKEMHSALPPLKALLALTNCIFIKD